MSVIHKILIANRGEIAVRIIRSVKEMGIATVAVYSEADRCAPHVRLSKEAICIGKSPSSLSYLNISNIIAAAKTTGANAIHPGYGFLSENKTFAQQVIDAGLIFIGPSPNAIALMGDKLSAKATVAPFGVPLIPGSMHSVATEAEAKKIAQQIGFPVLIKASAGGGGKGMRIAENEAVLTEHLKGAIGEAISYFSDGSVFIEKYLPNARHIEVQILGDIHGNIVHLFERECSIQRRHQKIIEESPAVAVTDETRKKMGKVALMVAQSCGYYSAGTVEFIMDDSGNFYFLEMNTRLQVEHTVTEAITGIDLVQLQVDIAQGKPLPFQQNEITMTGHAIEARICAEDPYNDFLPDTGMLKIYKPPHGKGIRVDDGYEQGIEVSIYYDSLLAKVICHAPSREEAIKKMYGALMEYIVTGVSTNINFCTLVMQHKNFITGNFDVDFIKKHFSTSFFEKDDKQAQAVVAMLAATLTHQNKDSNQLPSISMSNKSWKKNRF